MILKAGVRLRGARPELIVALIVASEVYREHGRSFTVTSVCDSSHSRGSLHYKGMAFDCRTLTAGVLPEEASKIADGIRNRLGSDFDVVVEKDHIHIEWDPKEL